MAVYIVRAGDDGPVKIGWAVSVKRRIGELQCGHPEILCVLRQVEGDRGIEALMHRFFASSRIRGEWFTFDPRMLTVGMEALDFPEGVSAGSPSTSLKWLSLSPVVRRAAEAVGGPRPLADGLGVAAPSLYGWKRIPSGRALAVERLTGIPRTELRPDIFPATPGPQREAAA